MAGRPNYRFYEILDQLKKDYVEMRATGQSIWRWCGTHQISLKTLEMYKRGECNDDLKNSDQYSQFLGILEQGDMLYKAYVHDIVTGNAIGDIKGNGACANLIASNVLGWSSKQEQKVEPGDGLKKFSLEYKLESEKDSEAS